MLSHKTLIMLLGYDPSVHPDQPLPCSQPQVTFAYTKHLWMSGKTREAHKQLSAFLSEYTLKTNSDDVTQDDRRRLLARYSTLSQVLYFNN